MSVDSVLGDYLVHRGLYLLISSCWMHFLS